MSFAVVESKLRASPLYQPAYPYLAILSNRLLPSEPTWPRLLLLPISLQWSLDPNASPSFHSKAGEVY
jgi:hypothetical protein